MGKQQLFAALVELLAVEIVVVNSHVWQNQPQRYSDGVFTQRTPLGNGYGQRNNIEIVQGTIDQLNRIDATWVCTNRKTGDQMIFGTEVGNSNGLNNGYPQQNSQMYPPRPSPTYNPLRNQPYNQGFEATPATDEQNENFIKPTTIEEVRRKWADFDWTQYVRINPTTIAPRDVPTITPPNRPHAGEGIIQVRTGV